MQWGSRFAYQTQQCQLQTRNSTVTKRLRGLVCLQQKLSEVAAVHLPYYRCGGACGAGCILPCLVLSVC